MKVNLRLTQGIFSSYLLHKFSYSSNLGINENIEKGDEGRESHADRIIIIIMWRVENLCFMLTQSTIYQVFMSSGVFVDGFLSPLFLPCQHAINVRL